MALTFSDVARLEQQLVDLGTVPRARIDAFLREMSQWFDKARPTASVVDSGDFAILCNQARIPANDRAGALAAGTLTFLRAEAAKRPERAAFAVRFALSRIGALSGEVSLWSTGNLSPAEDSDAQALFEAGVGDRSYSVAELTQAVQAFVARNGEESSMLGALASDLTWLLAVISDPNSQAPHVEIARAALTYFVILGDAVPDDLGLAGLLDDIAVVHKAIDAILPRRREVRQLLDGALHHWPFLTHLRLEVDGSAHPVSEFMLFNATLAAGSLWQDTAPGMALVARDPEAILAVTSVVRALGELFRAVRGAGEPAFEIGDRLISRDGKAEVQFDGYGRLEGTAFIPCAFGSATHFRFKKPPRKRNDSGSTHIRRIHDSYLFRHSSNIAKPLKVGRISLDTRTIALGPLEQLFGSSRPIVLPTSKSRVVLVSSIGGAHRFLSEVSIFGTPLKNAVPCGELEVTDEGVSDDVWTAKGIGGSPLLSVVRTTAEASALAQLQPQGVAAILAPVRAGSTDSMNLVRASASGVHVLAILDEGDDEGQEHLFDRGFRFWHWNREALAATRPSRTCGSCRHPIEEIERRVRRAQETQVRVHEVDVPGLGDAFRTLDALGCVDRMDSGPLHALVGEGFALLLRLCRTLTDLTAGQVEANQHAIQRMRLLAISDRAWWPAEVAQQLEDAVSALSTAAETLARGNPKAKAIKQWAAESKDGVLLAPRVEHARLAEMLRGAGVDIRERPTAQGGGKAAIPLWYRQERMRRLLRAGDFAELQLVLYEPERRWYALLERKLEDSKASVASRLAERPALPSMRQARPPSHPVRRESAPPPSLEPDEIVLRARRAQVLQQFSNDPDEKVTAHLVHFVGGYWAAFTPHRTLRTVTHLLSAQSTDEADIREVEGEDLQVGDLVLLLRGSDKDAIREAVDAIAPTGLRDLAGEWQEALRRSIARGKSLDTLRHDISVAGCKRTLGTIRRWLEDDTIIGPRHVPEDVQAILTATSDTDLASRLSECVDAIGRLRSLHLQVAHHLAAQVIHRAQEWMAAGVNPDELIEVEDRIVVVTVEEVDAMPIDFPKALVNRLQEA